MENLLLIVEEFLQDPGHRILPLHRQEKGRGLHFKFPSF